MALFDMQIPGVSSQELFDTWRASKEKQAIRDSPFYVLALDLSETDPIDHVKNACIHCKAWSTSRHNIPHTFGCAWQRAVNLITGSNAF
jgi:hypothetical protein